MFDTLFQFLFKYRPAIFEQGDFGLGLSTSVYVAVAVAATGTASALLTYRHVSSARDRVILTTLRLGALAIVLFCLCRPVLILKAAVPQQNVLGILLDDSRSMRIGDADGEARGRFVNREFGTDSALIKALSNRFLVRFFRFSSSTDRVSSAADLSFGGTQTRLGVGLDQAREALAGLPVAALVAVTDGADTTDAAPTESLLALKAAGIPVFTVGVGRDEVSRDIQVSRVTTPRRVLKGASLIVDVILTQTGYQGSSIPLNVELDGRIVNTQQVTLPRDGEPTTVRVRFTAAEAGPKVFRFRVPPQDAETVTENNTREQLVEVEDRREKILYFEGEPRFEMKFIRRAVADDKNLQIVTLQRTAENKYLRLDIDQPEELVAGFPKTRDELFQYRGLILGSVDAAAFTGDQLRMIAEFVDRRGGGLLAIGGRHALAEGGFAGTPVADALPVVIDGGVARADDAPVVKVNARPTRAGIGHAVTEIGATEQESADRWKNLPAVTSVNEITQVKPGATILLTGSDETRRDRPLLAYQRYGRGKSLTLGVQDTWLWQLGASVPVEDQSHENFWRQLARWLVDGVPDRVLTRITPDRVEPGEGATILADVADPSYVEVNNGHVVARVTGPSGNALEIPLQWTGERNGEYRGTFVPDEDGIYEASVEATRGGQALGGDAAYIRASPSDSEYFDGAMRAPLLERIARETGGRFYRANQVMAMADDVKYTGRGVTVVEERDLWDMPALLLLLVGCVLGDWSYRRVRGLA